MVPTSTIPNLNGSHTTFDSSPASAPNCEETTASALRAELALWLAAISAFLEPENYSFKESAVKNYVEQNWSNELRALHYAATRAAHLTARLEAKSKTLDFEVLCGEIEEFSDLYLILSRFSFVCEDLSANRKLGYYAWANLCESLKDNLAKCPQAQKLISLCEAKLPESLANLRRTAKAAQPFGDETLEVIARLNRLLTILHVVGNKLSNDFPLKNSLLFFSLIHGETKKLLKFIEGRMLRSMPPEHDFFALLDGTIYIISLELRKVYARELKGVFEIRPAPTVVARVETSHGLLQDCFQQSIILLANAFAPEIEGWRIFPNYQTRLEQSLVLRADIWNALQNVRRAEKTPETFPAEKVKKSLEHLRQNSLRFLMFKDCEPTERFIEEIVQTKRMQDITHVLHRFGAYLETLLGQVNMRGVLANHPFDYPKLED